MTAQASFDFDEWKTLAKHNPSEFEKRRRDRIERLIQACPDHRRQRLRGLQFRIDMERRRSKSNLGACIRMSEMMMEQLEARFRPILLGSLSTMVTDEPVPPRRADVIPLTPRR